MEIQEETIDDIVVDRDRLRARVAELEGALREVECLGWRNCVNDPLDVPRAEWCPICRALNPEVKP